MTTEMNSQQIYKSVLNSAIQKALRKNLPLILEDAIQYLEEHDWQVKERKKRSKKPPSPQNIEALEKRTQKPSAQKMKTTPYLNLNTYMVHSDSEQIKAKHPDLQFGNLTQGNTKVWVCATPGTLETALTKLTEIDEKSVPIFEPFSQMKTIPEDEDEDSENEVEEDENSEPENEIEKKEQKNSWKFEAEEGEEEDENSEPENEIDTEGLEEIYNILDQPENEAPPTTLEPTQKVSPKSVSIPIVLKGTSTTKKLKRRRRKKKVRSVQLEI